MRLTVAKILVIDDSIIIRNLLDEYLCDLGHDVGLAVDGQDGIDKALTGDYVVAVCDIHMPKKNGYQVFREVRDTRPEIAFVMTDSLPDELAERAQAEGAHAILTKPFDLHQVRTTIEHLLQSVKTR